MKKKSKEPKCDCADVIGRNQVCDICQDVKENFKNKFSNCQMRLKKMKYRIKEYNWYDGPKFRVQVKLFNLFWVDYGRRHIFATLEEASECIKRYLHNYKVKPIIHEIQN